MSTEDIKLPVRDIELYMGHRIISMESVSDMGSSALI